MKMHDIKGYRQYESAEKKDVFRKDYEKRESGTGLLCRKEQPRVNVRSFAAVFF